MLLIDSTIIILHQLSENYTIADTITSEDFDAFDAFDGKR